MANVPAPNPARQVRVDPDRLAQLGHVQLRLLLDGWQIGPPSQIGATTLQIDRSVVSRLRCPVCRAGRLTFIPYHRGQQYTGVARCLACKRHEEEV
jgi:hypothetical protein